jgi:hypothetical protein
MALRRCITITITPCFLSSCLLAIGVAICCNLKLESLQVASLWFCADQVVCLTQAPQTVMVGN